MNFLEKLDWLMESNDLNKNSFSRSSGIPYTTIDGFYKKGYDRVKISTLKKIASFFNVTIDFLVDESDEPIPSTIYSKEEKTLINAWRISDEKAKEFVSVALKDFGFTYTPKNKKETIA